MHADVRAALAQPVVSALPSLVPGFSRPIGEVSDSISKSSVHFVGFASRTLVLSSLRLRVHE